MAEQQKPVIEEIGVVQMKLCKMSGISKTNGRPYTMLTFKYDDPFLNKDVTLQPSSEMDAMKLKMIYIDGWMPPPEAKN